MCWAIKLGIYVPLIRHLKDEEELGNFPQDRCDAEYVLEDLKDG